MGGRSWSIETPAHIQTPLFDAITADSLEAVKVLIAAKSDLKWQVDDKGIEESPLIYAAELGRTEILELMLETKIRFSKDLLGMALVDAALNGHVEAAKLLVVKGANLNLVTSPHTPLTAAVYGKKLDIVKFLVGAEASVEQRNMSGFFPLSMAAFCGHVEIFDYLEPLTPSVSKKKEAKRELLERNRTRQHPVLGFLESMEMDPSGSLASTADHNNSGGADSQD
jgi:ankyrin repeat protein